MAPPSRSATLALVCVPAVAFVIIVAGLITGPFSKGYVSDGTVIANLSVEPLQRGTDGNDGEPYFEADFPDGPTITSFSVLPD